MRFETLSLSKDGRVAEIRLNRPERRNPIDEQFLRELDQAAAMLHEDEQVSVALLTAEGDFFSSGREEERAGEARVLAEALPFRALEEMGPAVIACIERDAIGAGLELALACDVRIAADDVTFALPDVAMGVMPADGATQRLPRLVGRAKAAEMILLGEPMSAADALACGLVNRVVPKGEVRERARTLAESIAARGPIAVRYAKEAMVRGADMPLEQALRYETDLTVILQTTQDRAEGVKAFLEKREPRFEGR